METTLRQMLDEARKDAQSAFYRDDLSAARLKEGRAEGIADAMEAMGMTPDPWKPRPHIASRLTHELQDCETCNQIRCILG